MLAWKRRKRGQDGPFFKKQVKSIKTKAGLARGAT